LARLFIDPRHFERAVSAAARGAKPTEARPALLLARYLAAVDYAGAVLQWSETGLAVHAVEVLRPAALDPWICRWASDRRRPDPELIRVPQSAFAIFSGHLDAAAAFDAFAQVVGDEDRSKVDNIQTLLTGLLLGQDLRSKVLPRLGPAMVAYVDAPFDSAASAPGAGQGESHAAWRLPQVVAVSLRDDEAAAPPVRALDAAESALRTVLALSALDEKRAQGRSRIVTRLVAGAAVTTLDTPIPFAFAVDRARYRVVLGNGADAVARYLECAQQATASEGRRKLLKAAVGDAETYLYLDFRALNQLAATHHDRVVQTLAARQHRPASEVDADLGHVLDLAQLFEAGYVTTRLEPDATAVYRSAGLVRRASAAPAPVKP
jgi:hypothetical protein